MVPRATQVNIRAQDRLRTFLAGGGGLVAAFVLVATLASAHAARRETEAAAGPAAAPLPDGYLVSPFANASGVKQLDWMTSALSVTAAEKLEAVPSLRPVYGTGIIDGLEVLDPTVLTADGPAIPAVAKLVKRMRDLGARYVVVGRFSRPNWKSELTVRVLVVDGERLREVATAASVGERAALITQLDALLTDLLAQLKIPPTAETLAAVRRKPTKDLYAFTLYGRGLNQLNGLGEPRDLTKAEKSLRKANLIDPKFAEGHRALGRVLLEQGKPQAAASQFAYASDLRPGYWAAVAQQARIYRQEGQGKRAMELAEKALEVRPYDVEMREMLGELLWEAAELDRALVELEKVVAIQPRNLPARRTLAQVYAAKGAIPDLAAELERVQELAPDDLEVKLDLGSAYQRMGAPDRAISAYEEVVKRQPKNTQAWKLLGDCHRQQKEPDKAILAYQRLKKLAPEDPRPFFLLGAAYEESGDDVRAEAAFQDAQQFRRYLGEAWTNLGSIAFRRGDLAKANWYLSRAVVRAPARPKAHYNYALVLSAKKERDRALDELRVAGDLDPQDAEIRYLAGVILLRQGRLDEAKVQFQEALKRRPDHPDAKHNLALLEDLERRYGGERSSSGSR